MDATTLSNASTAPNSLTVAQNAFRVGNSGHYDKTRLIQAHPSESLEVSQLGNHLAQSGMSGHSVTSTPTAIVTLPSPRQKPIGLEGPRRARMWQFSIPLRHPETGRPLVDLDRLRRGLDRKSIDQYMWLIHDRDQGSAPHVQGALKLRNSRAREQLASYLGLPASTLKPLIDGSGQHGAFERYCRYLLHEGPEARADGKFLYSDKDAHANFEFREMIDRYFGYASAAPVVSADLVKLMVLRGEMTPADVEATHPMIYIRNFKQIDTLYEKGAQERQRLADALERAARAEEIDLRHEAEHARRQRLSAQCFEKDEIDLAIKEGLSEEELRVRRAAAEGRAAEIRQAHTLEAAERKENEERSRAERESPQHKERMQREAEEDERRLTVALIARELDIRGTAEVRDAWVLREAIAQGFASRAYSPGAVISIEDARTRYLEAADLDGFPPHVAAAKLREDVACLRHDLQHTSMKIAAAEMHAVEGDLGALEKATQLRAMYGGYPDLITLPSPRSDLSRKQRTQLLEAEWGVTQSAA